MPTIEWPPHGWIYSDALGWLPPEDQPPTPPEAQPKEISPEPLTAEDPARLARIEQLIDAFLSENPPEPPGETQQNSSNQP